jgi:hypothetical protein
MPFLAAPQGIFSPDFKPKMPEGVTPAQEDKIYEQAAIESALENKKETLLGWMQKFDSYFFDVQKVPHLPGLYVLDQSTKTINIKDERLSWNLVLGNLVFEIQRTLLVTLGFIALGIWLARGSPGCGGKNPTTFRPPGTSLFIRRSAWDGYVHRDPIQNSL